MTDGEVGTVPADPAEEQAHRPALSPSRAGDFTMCPLLFRFRAIDRLPERPNPAQVRGTLVHTVLERLFDVPAAQRRPDVAHALVAPAWAGLTGALPELEGQLFDDAGQSEAWLASAAPLVEAYFALEDPRTVEPAARELAVEARLASGTPLRGIVDRLDETPSGGLRVVDYKTGPPPAPHREQRALFQLKFYAAALLAGGHSVPEELVLLHLGGAGERLSYRPEAEELARFTRILDALWSAIVDLGRTGGFRPRPSGMCAHCSYRSLCPAWDGTPPPYPGWPADPA